jgi:CRP-like cAMP-binding protein
MKMVVLGAAGRHWRGRTLWPGLLDVVEQSSGDFTRVRIMSDTIDILPYVPLFALLDDEERAALADVLEAALFPKGQAIFRTGDVGGALYLVNAGLVRLTIESNEGAQVILGEYGRGQMFGEISLLDGGPRTSTATALEDTKVLILTRSHLLEIITKYPHSAMDLLTVIGARLRATDQFLRSQVTRNVNIEAEERLTLGQRLADRVAAFGGSWPFILVFCAVMVVWRKRVKGRAKGDILNKLSNSLAAADLAAVSACRAMTVPEAARQQSELFGFRPLVSELHSRCTMRSGNPVSVRFSAT